MISTVIRGNLYKFKVRLYNADGVEITSGTVTARVQHKINKVATTATVTLSYDDDLGWTGTWSTVGKDLGDVDWHVSCASPSAAVDGKIRLVGNAANP